MTLGSEKKLSPLFTVTRRNFRNQHLYSITGEPDHQDMKSVTHYTGVIAKGGLAGWAKREALDAVRHYLYAQLGAKGAGAVELDLASIDAMIEKCSETPDRIRDAAANYGTRAHAVIDQFIRTGKMDESDKEIQPAIASFMKWWGKGRRIIMGDTFVASKKHRFGGAFDAIEERRDGYWIIDHKTSNALWPEMALQVGGGYSLGFCETFGVTPAGAILVRYGKGSPEVEVKEINDLSSAEAGFLHALGLKNILDLTLLKSPGGITDDPESPTREARKPAARRPKVSAVRP